MRFRISHLVICIRVNVDSTAKTRSNIKHRKSIRLVGRTRNRADTYGWIFISTTPRIIIIFINSPHSERRKSFFFVLFCVFCFLMMCFLKRQNKYASVGSAMGEPWVVGTLWVFVLSKFAYHELSEKKKEFIECRTICIFRWK